MRCGSVEDCYHGAALGTAGCACDGLTGMCCRCRPAGTHMMIKPWNYFDELSSMVSGGSMEDSHCLLAPEHVRRARHWDMIRGCPAPPIHSPSLPALPPAPPSSSGHCGQVPVPRHQSRPGQPRHHPLGGVSGHTAAAGRVPGHARPTFSSTLSCQSSDPQRSIRCSCHFKTLLPCFLRQPSVAT